MDDINPSATCQQEFFNGQLILGISCPLPNQFWFHIIALRHGWPNHFWPLTPAYQSLWLRVFALELLPTDAEVDSLIRLRTDRIRNMFAGGQREALSEADSGAGAPQLVQATLQAVAETLNVPQHVAADSIAHHAYLSGFG